MCGSRLVLQTDFRIVLLILRYSIALCQYFYPNLFYCSPWIQDRQHQTSFYPWMLCVPVHGISIFLIYASFRRWFYLYWHLSIYQLYAIFFIFDSFIGVFLLRITISYKVQQNVYNGYYESMIIDTLLLKQMVLIGTVVYLLKPSKFTQHHGQPWTTTALFIWKD